MDKRVLVFFPLILLFSVTYLFFPASDSYRVNDVGVLHYPLVRPANFTERFLNSSSGSSFYEVSFESKGTRVYGLLRVPLVPEGTKLPCVVLLPGAGRTKESEQDVGGVLSSLGYASFALDQRGIGETGGRVPSISEDYRTFIEGGEPVQHLFVYDALLAFDYASRHQSIDPNKILFLGESMGGRFAVIAASLEPRALGVVGISTAGYGKQTGSTLNETRFINSIDPDFYIGALSPRPVAIFHSINDDVIPFANAEKTASYAREPVFFYNASCRLHGYCEEMLPYLNTWLEEHAG